MMKRLAYAVVLLLLAAASPRPGFAQAQRAPQGALSGVAFDQNLNADLPLDLPFRDETGRTVKLGDYFGHGPVLLSLVYFTCPMLCTFVLDGQVRSLREVSFTPGREFQVVTVSFDPSDTPERARAAKKEYLERYGRRGAAAGWHFLTGRSDAIDALTRAVGFRYRRDPDTGQFAHAAGIMVATPRGKLARYFYGVEYPPRDLKLALMDAADNRIGSPIDQLLLYCCQWDPATGRYGLIISRVIQCAGAATVVILGGFMLALFRRGRRSHDVHRNATSG